MTSPDHSELRRLAGHLQRASALPLPRNDEGLLEEARPIIREAQKQYAAASAGLLSLLDDLSRKDAEIAVLLKGAERERLAEAERLLQPFGVLTPPETADDSMPIVLANITGGLIDTTQRVLVGDLRAARAFLQNKDSGNG